MNKKLKFDFVDGVARLQIQVSIELTDTLLHRCVESVAKGERLHHDIIEAEAGGIKDDIKDALLATFCDLWRKKYEE